MPTELLQARAAEAAQRFGCDSKMLDLFLYSLDDEENITRQWPSLGKMEPLNTKAGQRFMARLCKTVQPHLVIFDNVMALITGDQKDEVPWSETLPLVHTLTHHKIGQLWIDHTGHNTERQYGSSTKAWRFDAVGVLTELPPEQRAAGELAFILSFDYPGKARRRTPDNWHEFTLHLIWSRDDVWTSDALDGTPIKSKVKPSVRQFHSALLDAIITAPAGPGQTAMFAWETECIRRGLIDPAEFDETPSARHQRKRHWRTARSDLLAARWIGIDGERVSDLTQDYRPRQ